MLGIDLRIPSHSHVDMTAVLRHSVSVCGLKLLQDENYMLATDMGGGVRHSVSRTKLKRNKLDLTRKTKR